MSEFASRGMVHKDVNGAPIPRAEVIVQDVAMHCAFVLHEIGLFEIQDVLRDKERTILAALEEGARRAFDQNKIFDDLELAEKRREAESIKQKDDFSPWEIHILKLMRQLQDDGVSDRRLHGRTEDELKKAKYIDHQLEGCPTKINARNNQPVVGFNIDDEAMMRRFRYYRKECVGWKAIVDEEEVRLHAGEAKMKVLRAFLDLLDEDDSSGLRQELERINPDDL